MNRQLENKLALVTGSTAGIGFAIAKAIAAEGARVYPQHFFFTPSRLSLG